MGKLAEILAHPDEVLPTLRMYFAAQQAKKLPKDPDLAFCFHILNTVSRSFAVVINQLPSELRNAVCVFYLVLRALDTVEDDMSIPVTDKIPLLKDFDQRIQDPNFTLSYGTEHYQKLLKEFPRVHRVLTSLPESYQDVIYDITKQMGDGMAEFIEKDVITIRDYDLYCFYVAGLVGVGLSKLYARSKVESEQMVLQIELSRHMGLFLQKTNIIRDYLEDIMEEPAPRMFWPREIWSLYAEKLEDFKSIQNRRAALKCLNHLIVDTLRHLPHCFEYLELIQNPDVFRFCAIPQIMAIATSALCVNNGGVFEGVVKVRRGLTCKMFQDVRHMSDAYVMFQTYLDQISFKIPTAEMEDSIRQRALTLVSDAKALCKAGLKNAPPRSRLDVTGVMMLLFVCGLVAVLFYTLYQPETERMHHGEF